MDLISKDVIKLLNYRIQQEQYSSKIYEQMSLYLRDVALFTTADVYQKWSKEELTHAEWAKDYLISFGVMPELMEIDEPINDFKDIYDVFQKTYDHEVLVTNQCRELAKKALEENDFNLFTLAQKYNAEQVEEMDKVNDIIALAKHKSDVLVLDKYMERYL